jgi:quercetin dioxygenase-like cupin family protein
MTDFLNPISASAGEVLDLPWGRITWLVAGSIGNSDKLTFGTVLIKAGHANPVHRHSNCDEILHLLRGRIEHSFDDRKFIMRAGDTISIPAGISHNAHALDDNDAEMVICFSSADRRTESNGEEA